MPHRSRQPIYLGAILLAACLPAAADVCSVPGSHTSVQSAVDDLLCTQIELVAQTYTESLIINRSLQLGGPPAGGAVVRGKVSLTGFATSALLHDLRIENGCTDGGLQAFSGAQGSGSVLEVAIVEGLPCTGSFVFEDGFES